MNTDWTKLKQSSNGIPTNVSLIPYVLEVLKNGEEATNQTIRKRVYDFLVVPANIIAMKYPDDPNGGGILANRFSFALSNLYKAGAIKRPKRGVYQITEVGEALLEKHGDMLTEKILKSQPAFIKYMDELEIRNRRTGNEIEQVVDELEKDPRVEVGSTIKNMNNEVAIELLDKIRDSDPYFFERLVVDLLSAMGYSGENGEATVTQKSNDAGIDGIINQDPLGTSTVYLQAKRYKETNTIGRSAIQAFYGALADVHADRGVFITTSSYSKGAIEFAKKQGIVLIDGIQLTDLMLKYNVGVEVAEQYTVFRIDSDYFDLE